MEARQFDGLHEIHIGRSRSPSRFERRLMLTGAKFVLVGPERTIGQVGESLFAGSQVDRRRGRRRWRRRLVGKLALLLALHVRTVVEAHAPDRAVVAHRTRKGVDGARLATVEASAHAVRRRVTAATRHFFAGRDQDGLKVAFELRPVVEKSEQVRVPALWTIQMLSWAFLVDSSIVAHLFVDDPRVLRVELLKGESDRVLELVVVLNVVLEQILPPLSRVLL